MIDFMKRYEIGLAIFLKLFELNSNDLKIKLKNILKNKQIDFDILDKGKVIKTIKDDKPDKIEICFYSYISVDFCGIYYHADHSLSEQLVEFNEYFKL